MNSNIALYRKYRPKDFSEVIGQQNIVNTLKNSIQNNNILHAYIFSGTRGTGKTTIAKIFAKAINCLNLQDGYNPCLKCENCVAIDNNQTTDIIELDAASNNGVDEIRTIVDNVLYLPQKLKKKVYIIDEAHMLSNSAWNALLKTLEEPPNHVVFILATTEFHKIPITIVSRCQRYDFYGLEHNDLSTLIDKVSKLENINITSDAKEKLIQLSDTAARDCLSILEQLSIYSNNNITIEEINKVFGLVDLNFIIRFIDVLIQKDITSFIKYIAVLEKNYDINYFIEQIINCLMDYLIYFKTQDKALLKVLNETQIKKQNTIQEQVILELLDTFYLILKDIKTKGNPIFYLKYHLFEFLTQSNKLNNQVTTPIQQPIVNNIPTPVVENPITPPGRKLLKKPEVNLETKQPEPVVEPTSVVVEKKLDIQETITNTTQPKVVKETQKEEVAQIDKFDIYQRLALNNEKQQVIVLNELLEKVKKAIDEVSIEEIDRIIQKMNNFYLYSNNTSFVIVASNIIANRFNQLFFTDTEFRKQIRKMFESDKLYIFAITKQEALKYNNQIKESMIKEIDLIDYSKIKLMFNELDKDDIRKKILNIKNSNN